jgi:hypothetical protein
MSILVLNFTNIHSGNSSQSFNVDQTWIGPCHWQLENEQNTNFYIDSGYIDIAASEPGATPTTWPQTAPTATNTACTFPTSTTTSLSGSNQAPASGCAIPNHKLSAGAGIGIGIVIALGVMALIAGLFFLLHRRISRNLLLQMQSLSMHERHDAGIQHPTSQPHRNVELGSEHPKPELP